MARMHARIGPQMADCVREHTPRHDLRPVSVIYFELPGLAAHRVLRRYDAPGAPHVQRGRDDDATQPTGESGGLIQVGETAERAQVGLLRRILRQRCVTEHAFGNGVGHRLGVLNEASTRVEVPRARSNDQTVKRFIAAFPLFI
jgi:hypothetical protein